MLMLMLMLMLCRLGDKTLPTDTKKYNTNASRLASADLCRLTEKQAEKRHLA